MDLRLGFGGDVWVLMVVVIVDVVEIGLMLVLSLDVFENSLLLQVWDRKNWVRVVMDFGCGKLLLYDELVVIDCRF